MKTDSTPPSRRRQAENPPAARSTRHRTLARAGLHRLQHPLRGRHQDTGHLLRRHRRHPSAGPQARTRRGHRRATPPAQVPPPLSRESDHVLNFAYNALCNGTCLDDIELRRNDVVFLDALGADRIPDPTTAGDFCRRFTPDDVETLQDVFDQTRLKVWNQQPSDFFDEAVLDIDGTLVATGAGCKQGIDIAYDGTWGYHPLIVSLANTGEVLSIVNRPGNRPSHEGAAEQLDLAILLCRQAGFRTHLPPRRHRLHPDQATRRLGRRGRDVPLRHRRHAQPQGDRRGPARVGLGRAATAAAVHGPRGSPGSAPRRSRTGSSASAGSRP